MCGGALERHTPPVGFSFLLTLLPHAELFRCQMWGVFPPRRAIPCDTMRVSSSSIPARTGVSPGPAGEGLSPTTLPPTSDANRESVPRSPAASVPLGYPSRSP